MAKREILRAAKLKGIEFDFIDWEWTPTPGESVPVWSIHVNINSADRFGIDSFYQFGNTKEVLDWISELTELPEMSEE